MNTPQQRNAFKPAETNTAAHLPDRGEGRDTAETLVEIDPDMTQKPTRGIDPPLARKLESRLVTPAVECVVEWHRRRADARSRSL